MKKILLTLAFIGCSKQEPPIDLPKDFTGKTCAYGVVFYISETGIKPLHNPDGSPVRCEI